jgi:predicted dehydrogenase
MLHSIDLDAVFVLTQPDMLFRAAADSLLAGKHVFMEKPMGITAYQAKTLRDLSLSQNRTLHVGYNRRFIPLVKEIFRCMGELTRITHVEGRFYKNSSPAFYSGCAGAFICDVIHVIDLLRHVAAGCGVGRSGGNKDAVGRDFSPVLVRSSTLEITNPETKLAEAWYSTMEFDNGVSGLIRADYNTGGRVHQFELHGPNTSAFIDLGFGGAACSGRILKSRGTGKQSLSSGGTGEQEILEFDGIAMAGSTDYEVYYGYYEEDKRFLFSVLEHPLGADPERTIEDWATMELAEKLLEARIS